MFAAEPANAPPAKVRAMGDSASTAREPGTVHSARVRTKRGKERAVAPGNQGRAGYYRCMWRLTVLATLALCASAAETTSFTQTLYPALKAAGCPACHNTDGVASATRLHFPEPSATPAQIEAFGKSLVILVDPKNPEQSLLFRKPTNRIPHAGGERIVKGTPQEAALKAWVQQLAKYAARKRRRRRRKMLRPIRPEPA